MNNLDNPIFAIGVGKGCHLCSTLDVGGSGVDTPLEILTADLAWRLVLGHIFIFQTLFALIE